MGFAERLASRLDPGGLLYRTLAKAYAILQGKKFAGSGDYWETRYATGGNSGAGSYGDSARFKAEFLNDFFDRRSIRSVIEFGHGDGSQAAMLEIERYRGYDVSPTAVAHCRERFRDDPAKAFDLIGDYRGEMADAALSLDVVYHLVEDVVFDHYMRNVFRAADRHAVFYSTNEPSDGLVFAPHVRHRRFADWIASNAPGWRLDEHVPSPVPPQAGEPSLGLGFYVYSRS